MPAAKSSGRIDFRHLRSQVTMERVLDGIGRVQATADFAAVLYTAAPANGEATPVEPLDVIALEKRMATTLPDGWKLA